MEHIILLEPSLKLKIKLRKSTADLGSGLIVLWHGTNKEQTNLFLAGIAGAQKYKVRL